MYDPLQVIALEMRVWLRETDETTDTPNLNSPMIDNILASFDIW